MRLYLTRIEAEAVRALLDERLSGGEELIRDSLGCSEEEASELFEAAERAREKIAQGEFRETADREQKEARAKERERALRLLDEQN